MSFENQSHRTLRFDAQDSGKGTFQFEEPQSNWSEPAKPTPAKWISGSEKQVTFMGQVQFPIGNVGRETGTVVFKGTFESSEIIKGEFAFFPTGQDPTDTKATPSKTGKFKATRI